MIDNLSLSLEDFCLYNKHKLLLYYHLIKKEQYNSLKPSQASSDTWMGGVDPIIFHFRFFFKEAHPTKTNFTLIIL